MIVKKNELPKLEGQIIHETNYTEIGEINQAPGNLDFRYMGYLVMFSHENYDCVVKDAETLSFWEPFDYEQVETLGSK